MEERTTLSRWVFEEFKMTTYQLYNEITPRIASDINFRFDDDTNAFVFVEDRKRKYWHAIDSKSITDKELKEYYGDITKTISIEKITIVIEEKNDKVSLKLYSNTKMRNVGLRHFIVRKWVKFITFNTKTKNFYYGLINRKKKKLVSEKLRVNHFNSDALNFFVDEIPSYLYPRENKRQLLIDVIDQFFKALYYRTGIELCPTKDLDGELFKLYLLSNNFVCPDSYSVLRRFKYPKSDLKKYKNPVKIIMRQFELRGRKIRELLNSNRKIDYIKIFDIYYSLGIDKFNNITFNNTWDSYSDLFVIATWKYLDKANIFYPEHMGSLNNKIKQSIVRALNDGVDWNIIINHFRLIESLKTKYQHIFHSKFKDGKTFNDEHYYLAELLESYTRGIYYRKYGDEFKSRIEQPIIDGKSMTFIPVLLTTTGEYNIESEIQHNCVRGYVDKSNCFIISLRKHSTISTDRATIEYMIYPGKLQRAQTRGKHNNNLDESWNEALNILDKRINKINKLGLFILPELIIKYPNGITKIKLSDFERDNNGIISLSPKWFDK